MGSCRQIYHTWILWVGTMFATYSQEKEFSHHPGDQITSGPRKDNMFDLTCNDSNMTCWV